MSPDTGDSQQPPGGGPPPIRINRRTLLLGFGALTAIGTFGYWITEEQPGAVFATVGFNSTHLGPTIRAARGERVRIHVTNDLTMLTTAH